MQVHEWLLTLGAVVRITRFLNADLLAEPIRAAVERRFGEDSKPAYLVSCPWCASMWVALLAVPAAMVAFALPVLDVVAYAITSILCMSYAAGIADANLERE